jgi:glycosyltransferase involved in cell wall biosynthesis
MDEIKKKNFILINSLGGGGAERQVSLISKLNDIDKIILLEPIVNYPIPNYKLCYLSTQPNATFTKIKTLFTFPFKLKKIGLDRNTNLFCFLQFSYILGFLCKILFKCNFIICIRTSPIGFYKEYKGIKIPFFIYKFILNRADKILCNSKTSCLQLKSILKNKNIHSISNGYDIVNIKNKASEEIGELDRLFANHEILITVGRLVHDKSQWNLIRIFSALRKNNPTIKLAILGEGPLLESLIRLCKSLNLNVFDSHNTTQKIDNEYDVFFLGFVENPYKYVSKSKLFILTSLYEGLPNVVIESLIVNTPCIVSDCLTGPREILFPDADLLTQTKNEMLADCGILLPVFDGNECFINSENNEVEDLWISSISKLLMNEDGYQKMKENCSKIQDRYNENFILTLWQNHF